MSENLTPHDAVRVMADAARFEDALAERTGGITWMIWGFVGPGIFLSYLLAETLAMPPGPLWGLLWAPWVAGGIVATMALWRSAALAVPTLADESSAGTWVRWIGATLAIVLAMTLAPATAANEPLVVIGLFWAAMGALNLFCSPARARRVAIVAGTLALAVAFALAVLGIEGPRSDVAAAIASGAIAFGAGLYHTLRG